MGHGVQEADISETLFELRDAHGVKVIYDVSKEI